MKENRIVKKIKLSNKMKNVMKISSGTMGGQLISFITLPIIARMYGATIMGNWTTLNSIAIIINSFSDIGLINVIMVEKDEEKMADIYKMITTMVMFFSVLSGMGAILYYSLIPNSMGINTIFLGITLAILVFTLQQTQICYTWLNRKEKYEVLMKNPLINNAAIGIVAFVLAFMGVKKYGYYIAVIVGQFITIIHMKRFLPKQFFSFNLKKYKMTIKERWHFVAYQMPTNVLSQVKNQLPVLLIRNLFGARILGYYSVSVKILNIPITLLANALGRVFFQTISDMVRKGEEIGEFVYRNIIRAMKVAIVPMIMLIAFGNVIVIMLFGHEYEMAGTMLQIVSFQNFFTFLMMSSQGITITLDKQKYAMMSCIAQSIGFIIGLCIGKYIFNDIYVGLLIMSVIFVVIQIIYFCALFKVMKISYKKYIYKVIASLTIIIVCSYILYEMVSFGIKLL